MEVSVVLAVDCLDFVIGREAIAERTGIPDELGTSAAPIKLRQYFDHSLALGLRLGEAHRFLEFVFRNINRRLHASIVTHFGIHVKISWNTVSMMNGIFTTGFLQIVTQIDFLLSTGSSRPSRTSKPRSRFVTYVVPEDAQSDPSRDPAANRANRETEQAGIRRVKWFEEAEGRIVIVMLPNHPGYDIESRNGQGGEVERYIEVKSQSGSWGAEGVGLTVTEFNKARELRDRYWLYVVEWATSDQPEIYRIQDPAGRANWFSFDRGWSQVSN